MIVDSAAFCRRRYYHYIFNVYINLFYTCIYIYLYSETNTTTYDKKSHFRCTLCAKWERLLNYIFPKSSMNHAYLAIFWRGIRRRGGDHIINVYFDLNCLLYILIKYAIRNVVFYIINSSSTNLDLEL